MSIFTPVFGMTQAFVLQAKLTDKKVHAGKLLGGAHLLRSRVPRCLLWHPARTGACNCQGLGHPTFPMWSLQPCLFCFFGKRLLQLPCVPSWAIQAGLVVSAVFAREQPCTPRFLCVLGVDVKHKSRNLPRKCCEVPQVIVQKPLPHDGCRVIDSLQGQ